MSGAKATIGPPKYGVAKFHPITTQESANGIDPSHATYLCGACGRSTNGRVLCRMLRRHDSANMRWCICSCERHEPTVIVEVNMKTITQLPAYQEFQPKPDWNSDTRQLYEEAAKAFAAGAFTTTAMACRKILMVCACDKGAEDGKAFTYYVDFIVNQVLTYPAAQRSIDAIRGIGNEANHGVAFVCQDDAKRAMKIVTYMLDSIYSLPIA